MNILLINLLGAASEIVVSLMLFSSFWCRKNIKRRLFVVGILLAIILNIVATAFLQNKTLLPIVSTVILFALSFYYVSGIITKIPITLLGSAILFLSEQFIAFLAKNALAIPIVQVQNDPKFYLTAVLVSKLFSLFIIYIIKVITNGIKQEADKQFNLLMTIMPLQSMILCFIAYGYTADIDALRNSSLWIVAVIISLVLVFVIVYILNSQHKALLYKKEYELSQSRLSIQIEHYQKLYQAQREVRSIRHDISNELVAISGILVNGNVQDAISRINGIHSDLVKTLEIVDTKLPPVDAVLTAKINRACELDIRIQYKVLIDDTLNIDQFDLAIIVANALDNSIEAIARSCDVDKSILLHISSAVDYITVLVENYSSGPVDENFKTSNLDTSNHGFGIAQIKSIAHKYNGDVQPNYNPQTRKFSLLVMLQNHQI
jgi:hypothetical protein